MAAVAKRIWVYGRVQGVGFRYSTQQQATSQGLKGYARNLDDGSVEVMAYGEENEIEALIAWLKAGGPRTAKVDRVLAEPFQPREEPRGFTTG